MTVVSMTGFGKGLSSDSNYRVVVEIKSVNHRFKDVRFKMPSSLSSLEIKLRELLGNVFKRGSFDVYVNVKRLQKEAQFDLLDEQKIQAFVQKIKKSVAKEEVTIELRPTEFLRNEFYQDQEDTEIDEALKNLLLSSYDEAIQGLKKSREEEGQKLSLNIEEHVRAFSEHFKTVEEKIEDYQKLVEDKLKKRVKEFSSEMSIDESRFLQEVVYYMEKLDVHEEINRIKAHLTKLQQLLSKKGEVGRELDFVIQELNRETNTIASKSGQGEISEAAVQMKVHLEKMREQALNIE